jgi:hypothetical protein
MFQPSSMPLTEVVLPLSDGTLYANRSTFRAIIENGEISAHGRTGKEFFIYDFCSVIMRHFPNFATTNYALPQLYITGPLLLDSFVLYDTSYRCIMQMREIVDAYLLPFPTCYPSFGSSTCTPHVVCHSRLSIVTTSPAVLHIPDRSVDVDEKLTAAVSHSVLEGIFAGYQMTAEDVDDSDVQPAKRTRLDDEST